MKKLILILSIISIAIGTLHAQVKVGAGLFYGTDIDNLGISVNGTYDFDENWSAAPSFTYFLQKDNVNWSVLDLDANYVFTEVEKLGKIYALAGLSITFWSFNYDNNEFFNFDTNGSDACINIGAGFKTEIKENLLLVPEIRYSIGDCSYLRFGAKILFSVNK